MAFDRAAAKEAGYSNEEIEAFIAANPHVETKQDKDQRQATKLPSPEEVMGRTGSNPSQEVDRTNEGLATTAMAAGAGAAAVGVPAAAIYAGKKIFSPAVRAGSDLAQRGVGAMESANAINKMGVENLQNRFDVNQANKMAANAPKGPVVPQAMPGVSTAGPVAPANMPAANQPQMRAPQPSMTNRVQAAAAQRISNLPAMGEMLGGAMRTAGRILGPASLALESSELGPKTPQSGRMRGMEINPLTGAPWTPQQIAQYEANPGQYDSQMAPPQFRR
jgi:hypothetical protein